MKHAQQQDFKYKIFCILLYFYSLIHTFYSLNGFLKEMMSYRPGTANDFHWGLNELSAVANLILTQHKLKSFK